MKYRSTLMEKPTVSRLEIKWHCQNGYWRSLLLSPGKIRPTGLEVKCICLLNHPIPNTYNAESVQIIIPGPQVGRVNDTFVCCMGNTLQTSAPGIYVAIVSTLLEKGQPDNDVAPRLQLLGPILKRFMSVTTTYEPVTDGSQDKCYITVVDRLMRRVILKPIVMICCHCIFELPEMNWI
jgi:RAB protein geranylgeranyltransferase component A